MLTDHKFMPHATCLGLTILLVHRLNDGPLIRNLLTARTMRAME